LGVNGVHIANQNNVLNAPHSEYFWLRDSPDVALRWVWARSQDPARRRSRKPDHDRRSRGGSCACSAQLPRSPTTRSVSGTIAQCLNLEDEFHHTVSKLCILGFDPLK
jgi:hypothetical protein